MNKIFKVVWSKTKECYVVVSEVAKNNSGKKKVLASVLAALAVVGAGAGNVGAYSAGGGNDNGNTKSVAIGNASNTNGDSAVAIGDTNQSKKLDTITIGHTNTANTMGGIAIGLNNTADSSIGDPTTANKSNLQLALGRDNRATSLDTIAIGREVNSTKTGAVAMGSRINANGDFAVAIGNSSQGGTVEAGDYAVAVGFKAKATGGRSIAQGGAAEAAAPASIAMGLRSKVNAQKATSNYEFSGSHGVTSPAGYTTETITVNAAAAPSSGAVPHNFYDAGSAVAIGNSATVSDESDQAVVVGADAKTVGNAHYSVVLGPGSRAEASDGFVGGHGSYVQSRESIAIGAGANVSGKENIRSQAIGFGATVLGTGAYDATAIGATAQVTGVQGGVALGSGSMLDRTTASNENVGWNSKYLDGTVVRNRAYKATVTSLNDQWDAGAQIGAVSVGNDDQKRQIINVAAGNKDTDAVNVAQLKNVGVRVGADTNTAMIGTNKVAADFLAYNGQLNIKGDNNRVTTVSENDTNGKDANVNVKFDYDGLVKAKAGSSVTVNQKTEGGKTVFEIDAAAASKTVVADGKNTTVTGAGTAASPYKVNVEGALTGISSITNNGGGKIEFATGGTTISGGPVNVSNNKITGVAKGDVNATSTDAVNGSQLYAVKAAERHIKPTTTGHEYTVDSNGNVTMTYLDGNNNAVTGEQAVITGIAKQDLSNITNEGKKEITKLGTIVQAGDNVTVTSASDGTTGRTTYTVNAVTPAIYTDKNGNKVVKRPNGTYTTNLDGSAGNDVAANDVIVSFKDAAGNTTGGNSIVNNVGSAIKNQTGATYLDKLDAAAGDTKTQNAAVNVTDLKNTADGLSDKGLKFNANEGGVKTNKLGSTVTVQGSGTLTAGKAYTDEYNTDNIRTKIEQGADGNTTINVGLAKALKGINSISNGTSSITLNSNPGGTNNTPAVQITGGNLSMGNGTTNHKIVNLAPGTEDTDAVNYGQIKGLRTEVKPGANVTVNKTQGADGHDIYTISSTATGGTASSWNIKSSADTTNGGATATGHDANAVNISDQKTVEMVAGKNLVVKQTSDNNGAKVEFALNKDLSNLDKVVVNGKDGQPGKDGVTILGPQGATGATGIPGTNGIDGKVGIAGKDGKDAVSIAGKDGVGTIGLTGPQGPAGADGKGVDITTDHGTKTLVNPEVNNGDKSERIVYVPKDKDGNPLKDANNNPIKREVATMDDGLKFGGDMGAVGAVKLNKQVDVKGGITDANKLATGNNIGVTSAPDTTTGNTALNIQLAKDLTGLNSVQLGGNTIKTDGDHITITSPDTSTGAAPGATTTTKVANLSDEKHIKEGTYAVDKDGSVTLNYQDGNKKDLTETAKITGIAKQDLSNITNDGKKEITKLGTIVKAGDNVTVTSTSDGTTGRTTYTVNAVTPAIYTKADGTKVVKRPDGTYTTNLDGSAGNDVAANDVIVSFKDAAGNTTGGNSIVNNVGSAIKNQTGATYLDKLDAAAGDTKTQNAAVNVTDLKNTADGLTNKGLRFDANEGNEKTNKLGSKVTVKGTGVVSAGKAFTDEYNTANIRTNIEQGSDGNTTINVGLAKALKGINSVSNGNSSITISDVPTGATTPAVSITGGNVDVGGNNITNLKSGGNTDSNAANIGDVKTIASDTDTHIKPGTYTVAADKTVTMTYVNGKGDTIQENGKDVVAKIDLSGLPIGGPSSTEKVQKANDVAGDKNIAVVNPKAGDTFGGANATYEVSVSRNAVKDAAREAVIINNGGTTSGTTYTPNSDNPITVTPTDDGTNHNTTYAVTFDGTKAAKQIPLTYKATNGSTTSTAQTVTLDKGLNFTGGDYTTASVGTDGKVVFDVNLGTTPTVTDGKPGVPGQAGAAGKDGIATVKTVVDTINNSGWKANAKANGGTLDGTATATVVKPGNTVNYAAGKNITVKQELETDGAGALTGNQTYTYSLNKDIDVENVHVGINGKDGKIGIDGKDGVDGLDGTNRVDIRVEKGAKGVDGTDGHDGVNGHNGKDGMTRIVYEDKGGKQEVATLNDGLNFTGNNESKTNVQKLNSKVKVQGEGVTENATTHKLEVNGEEFKSATGNIAVVADGHDTLTVKLNEKLKGLDSVQTKTVELGDHTTPGKTTTITYNDGDKRIEYTTPGATPGTTDTKKVATTDDIWTIQGNGTDVKPVNGKVNVKAGENVVITTPTTADGSMTINAVSPVVYTTPAGDKLTKKSDGKFYKADGSEYTGGDIIASFENPNANSIPAGKLNTTDGGMIINNVGSAIKNQTPTMPAGQTATYLDKLKAAADNVKTQNAAVNVSDLHNTAEALKANELHIRPTASNRAGETVNKNTAGTADEVYKYDATTKSVTLKYNDGTGAGVTGTEAKIDLSDLAGSIQNYGFQTNAAGNLETGTNATATAVASGKTVTYAAGKNLTVKQEIGTDGNQTYTYALNKDLTNLDKVVVNGKDGQPGKDGVTILGPQGATGATGIPGTNGIDGKVGIAGKDGKDAVSIAGKDGVGTIGLTGPQGPAGADGKGVDITTDHGTKTLVNPEVNNGDKSERIVYVPKDKDGNPLKDANNNPIKREVATMDDGLKFTGNNTVIENKQKLGSLVKVQGEGTKEGTTVINPTTGEKELVLSDGTTKFESAKDNIAVVADGADTLTVKLNKKLKGLDSVQTKTVVLGNPDVANGTTNITYNPTDKRIEYVTPDAAGTGTTTNKVANLDDEKHIKAGSYAVQNDGSVTMTYVDGNNKDVPNDKAVITGIAKQNLSNIDNAGKTVITGLGTIVKAGDNVTVTSASDGTTGQTTYTVNAVTPAVYTTPDGEKLTKDKDGKFHKVGETAEYTGDIITSFENPKAVAGQTTKDGGMIVNNIGSAIKNQTPTMPAGQTATYLDKLKAAADDTKTQNAAVNVSDLHNTANALRDNELHIAPTAVKTGSTEVTGGVASGNTNPGAAAQAYKYNATTKQVELTFNDGNGKAVADTKAVIDLSELAGSIQNYGFKTNADGNLKDGTTATATAVASGKTVTYAAGKNLTVEQKITADGNQTYTYALNKDLTNLDKIVVNGKDGIDGKDGVSITGPKGESAPGAKDGQDGKVGIAGKDGKDAVSISGKDGVGHIGLQGPKGTPGTPGADGASLDISTDHGTQTLVKPEANNDNKSERIVYVPKDKDGNPLKDTDGNVIKREVATMDDGLKFAGDDGNVIKKALGTQLDIVGGATGALSDNNIGVNNDNGKLKVQLAKNIDLTKDGSVTMGNTVVNNDGITITKPATATDPAKTVSLTGDGLNNGGNTITNVAAGKNDTDAVNVSQLKGSITTVQSSDGSISVTDANASSTDPTKGHAYDIKINNQRVVEKAQTPVVYTDKDGNKLYKIVDPATGNVTFNTKEDGTGTTVQPNKVIASMNNGGDSTTTPMKLNNVGSSIANETGATFLDKLDSANTNTPNGAVNVSDLKSTADDLIDKGLKFDANSGGVKTNKLGSTVKVQGAGTKADNEYSGENIKTIIGQDNDGNTTIDVKLDKNLKSETITVTGQNGKDGKIGLNGKDGTNGLDGTTRVDIQVEKGVDGIDGKNGADGISRIVYEDKTGKHTVATMEDGLAFKGDNTTVVKKKLGEQLDIIGGADSTKLTDNNIGVNADNNGKLKVQLAQNIDLTKDGSVTMGNTKVNKDGITITNPTDSNKNVSLTGTGLNNGGNKITNVKAGEAPTDAVNVQQLNDKVTTVKSSDNTISVKDTNLDNAGHVIDKTKGHQYDITINNQGVVNNAQTPVVYTKDDGTKVYLQPNGTFNTDINGNGTVVPANEVIASMNNADKSTTTPMKLNNVGSSIADKTGTTFLDKINTAANDPNAKNGAVNVTDLKKTSDALIDKGLVFDANNADPKTNKLGSKVTIAGTGTLATGENFADKYNTDNIRTNITQDPTTGNTTVEIGLNKNLKGLESVSVPGKDGVDGKDGVSITGKDGANGVDGKVGIAGKNGKDAVSISGKDGIGHIGLTGPAGKDGKNATADITVKEGKAGVDGKDGVDGITRIVYNDKGGNEHQVATHDDGLKFTGNNESTVNKHHLNSLVKVQGEGVTEAQSTSFQSAAGNINVKANGTDTLEIQLNKDLKGINSIRNSANGPVMNFNAGDIAISGGNLDMGGSKITNLGKGINDTDAVNLKQLKDSRTTVSSKDGSVTITPTPNGDSMNYDLKVNPPLDPRVDQLAEEIGRVGAQGAALSALKPIQYDPLEPTQIMAGYGNYRGNSAIAMGVAHYKNESTLIHGGISWAGGSSHMMANAGVTWKVGNRDSEAAVADRYRKGPISSAYAMQQEMAAMKAQNAGLKGEVSDLKAENEQMKAQIAAMMAKLGL